MSIIGWIILVLVIGAIIYTASQIFRTEQSRNSGGSGGSITPDETGKDKPKDETLSDVDF